MLLQRLASCLVLLVLFLSCAAKVSTPQMPPIPVSECRMVVRVQIDPAFTPGQHQAVDDALAAWDRGTGGWLCFTPGAGGFGVVKADAPHVVLHADQVGAAQGVKGVVVGLAEHPNALILTGRLGTDDEVFRTVVHEIGHLLGLPHYEGPESSFMHPNIQDDPHDSRYLTTFDSQAFCRSVHGCER